MKLSDMLQSKYLKKEDVQDEVIATIVKLEKKNVALEDQPPEYKWLLTFEELTKPLILNVTNIRILGKAFGEETGRWMGQQVILYVDEGVTYAGQLVGGIRLRVAKRRGPGGPRAPRAPACRSSTIPHPGTPGRGTSTRS
jgi:hypothetical protein